jgi:hypothetical protein
LRSPNTTPPDVSDHLVRLRAELAAAGLDAGVEKIRWHLRHHHGISVSAATIHRHLRRAGVVEPEPKKRPRSSYVRLCAELTGEMWQSDFTHYPLEDGEDVEILSFLDDHARFALSATAHRRVTGPIVLAQFRHATACHGVAASTLTDNSHGLHHPLLGRPRAVATASRPSSSASGPRRRTPAPTTRPPAARSSASDRR